MPVAQLESKLVQLQGLFLTPTKELLFYCSQRRFSKDKFCLLFGK